MLRPFVAYLRVYEPLPAFGDPPDELLAKAVGSAELTRAAAGEREHLMWLRSQLTVPPRLLPAELADGTAAPSTTTDVLVLDPAEVPVDDGDVVGPGPLVCPLELRARSAAALVGFLAEAHPALRTAVLDAAGVAPETVRSRASAAVSGLRRGAMHVLSTTWTVPLPWFALVDPEQRRLVLGSGPDDPARELSWRATIGDARRRATEARELVEATIGESGPSRVLAETQRWLEHFHPGSAVELDYGGLVQLISDPVLDTDTSAEEVHRILDALREGNVEELAELFQDLRDYWGELASRERWN
ncbi:hypothetical protein SAMN05421810_103295 [Amycolatopsis arida]|uniref:DUF8083 domain-containing protein n=1 Tax=Amycolatopsis arida TaxID=587909 RepID=A0A1I5SVZ3_9PSEU|nr:hypothetical protein [Amycolatopsis arida]TDX96326.1 hypothetical protein CLV69_103463 [Amycolatopsis arida]SFP74923.1 hypothetical protein SAMN05421810_103295 [Amycolatopsis arida]